MTCIINIHLDILISPSFPIARVIYDIIEKDYSMERECALGY